MAWHGASRHHESASTSHLFLEKITGRILAITETCPCNYRNFFQKKKMKISLENFDMFLIFAQNIDCGYTLEPPLTSPTIYVLEQNKKNRYTPAYFSFAI